jgi:hypothetical protein
VRLQAASISGKESDQKPKKQAAMAAEAILQDERFSAMFNDPAFAIDTHSKEYLELHPSAGVLQPWQLTDGIRASVQ